MTAAPDAPVVVGVDASPLSLSAVRLAAREAASHHRPLTVMHAFNWAPSDTEPAGPGPRLAADELLDRAIGVATQAEPRLTVRAELAEGSTVATLVRRSETAALVAMGDGHLANCTCVPSDAPAVQVAARAGSPVLIVRENPPPEGPVLVGVDGSASSHAALEYALDCAACRGVRLLVVQVTEPERADGGTADRLADTVAQQRRNHPQVEVQQRVISGEPGQVLIEQSRGTALAVVGARGAEPWRGMLGEVSQALLYHSPAPVIVVRGVTSHPPGVSGGPAGVGGPAGPGRTALTRDRPP